MQCTTIVFYKAALRERTELSIKQEQLLTTLDSQHSQLVTEGELDAASVEHAPKHVTPLKELAFRKFGSYSEVRLCRDFPDAQP